MSEVIRVRGEYYILATSPLADNQTRVLKQGETFAIFDIYGDVRRLGRGEQGVYHKGTRHLSRAVLTLGDERPLLLSSSVATDNVLFATDLANPDMTIGNVFVSRGTLHIFRSVFLWEGACYTRLRLLNYGEQDLDVELSVGYEADFVDIFEVRGTKREKRGRPHEVEVAEDALVMRYEGLDGVERRTRVIPSPEGTIDASTVRFNVGAPSKTPVELFVVAAFEEGAERRNIERYPSAIVHQRESQKRMVSEQCEIESSNELFNAWLHRSLADLRMMTTHTPQGVFPYAGVPWYSCPFGRDAIITALQLLWIDPALARGVLGYLASTQATEVDEARAAEPGKILHEKRTGEMAALDEVPFGEYYGSVDSTPLFVALAGEYLAHTNDVEFISSIWSNVEAALRWIDTYGDADGDGFVEYRGSERGLVQQGWKDSHDAIFHADGTIAPAPIALCEVQGYVYWAKRAAARMAVALGFVDRIDVLEKQADALRDAFDDAFWSDDLGMYVLALDGSKRRCEVRASNAGHCLLSGIAHRERAKPIAAALASDVFFSGWGIRTLATSEVRYGPITYHNGSVWPHDNALIAQGLANYGYKDHAHAIFASLLDASVSLEFHRLPELYCGFPRRPGQGPVEYPLACAPQAWASGSIFLLLKACLGLTVDGAARRVVLTRPSLPPFLKEIYIRGLKAGDATLDLALQRTEADVGTSVVNRAGDVELVTVK